MTLLLRYLPILPWIFFYNSVVVHLIKTNKVEITQKFKNQDVGRQFLSILIPFKLFFEQRWTGLFFESWIEPIESLASSPASKFVTKHCCSQVNENKKRPESVTYNREMAKSAP